MVTQAANGLERPWGGYLPESRLIGIREGGALLVSKAAIKVKGGGGI